MTRAPSDTQQNSTLVHPSSERTWLLPIRVAKVLEYTDRLDGWSLLLPNFLTGQTFWAAALGLFLGLGPLEK